MDCKNCTDKYWTHYVSFIIIYNHFPGYFTSPGVPKTNFANKTSRGKIGWEDPWMRQNLNSPENVDLHLIMFLIFDGFEFNISCSLLKVSALVFFLILKRRNCHKTTYLCNHNIQWLWLKQKDLLDLKCWSIFQFI